MKIMTGEGNLPARPPLRVLYVEDNPQDADLTLRHLQRHDPHIQAQVVTSQKMALKILNEERQPCDVVLIDRNLTDGDGLSLLVKLRSLNLPVAIVMVTGSGDEETVIAALKSGADDYIIKSGDYLNRLPLVLEAALQHHRLQVSRYNRPLKVLYAEHHPADIDLTRRYLDKNAPYITLEVVHTARQVLEVLSEAGRLNGPDVLLVDYQLPGGLNALELIKEIREVRHLSIPIVLVTGQGDEMIALQALRLGVQDYIPKTEHYLARLPYALADAYHRARLEQEHDALRSSEERFRSLFMNSPVAMLEQDFSLVKRRLLALKQSGVDDVRGYLLQHPEIVRDLMNQSAILSYNRAALRLYGVDEENPPASLGQLLDFEAVWQDFIIELSEIAAGQAHFSRETADILPNGRCIFLNLHWNALDGYEDTLERVIVALEDITERKQTAERIERQLHQMEALRLIDDAISSNLELDQTLQVLIQQMHSQLNLDAVAVLLYDPSDQTLTYAAGSGKGLNFPLGLRFNYQQSLSGKAIENRRILPACRLDEDCDCQPPPLRGFSNYLRQAGYHTMMAVPLVTKTSPQGVIELYFAANPPQDLEWQQFLTMLAGQAAIAIENARLYDDAQRSNRNLLQAYDATIEGWTRAIDLRDKETEGHTQRVVELVMRLCRKAGMSEDLLVHVRRGALLHDIGKLGIPDAILLKPGPLTDEEWIIMRRHPQYAYEMISPIEYLRPALDIPYCHHEKWDGSGYPRGLKGEQIPLAARIFAVVDVWDALTSDRPYRPAWSKERALAYLIEQKGRHFDPQAVELFLQEMGFAETDN
ncbi:MAG: hypothetical protein KatS3mg045_0294 [Bellilinea sp.]|nr:MAG: hypothetical protein KatS3mg045_0294 [Bellilinea sp.]